MTITSELSRNPDPWQTGLERSCAQQSQRAAAVWLRGAAVSGLALGSGFGLRLEGSNCFEYNVFVLLLTFNQALKHLFPVQVQSPRQSYSCFKPPPRSLQKVFEPFREAPIKFCSIAKLLSQVITILYFLLSSSFRRSHACDRALDTIQWKIDSYQLQLTYC